MMKPFFFLSLEFVDAVCNSAVKSVSAVAWFFPMFVREFMLCHVITVVIVLMATLIDTGNAMCTHYDNVFVYSA